MNLQRVFIWTNQWSAVYREQPATAPYKPHSIDFCLLGLLRHRGVHGRTPQVAVLGNTASHDLEVELLQCAADWSDFAITDGAVIDHHDGRELRSCAAQEYFVRDVEFGAVDLAFARNAPKLAMGQFHHGFARDTEQDILGWRGCDQFIIDDQEDIFRAALRNMPIVCQHDGLVEAVLYGLAFSESRIDVRAGDFSAGGDSIIIDASPRRNAAVQAAGFNIVAEGL